VDSLPAESSTNLEAVCTRARTTASHGEHILPVVPSGTVSDRHRPGPISGEPQYGPRINQASRVPDAPSQMLGESSERSGAPNIHIPVGEGGSGPYIVIASETPQLQIEASASTLNGGIDQIADAISLEEVVPFKGPMIGGITIVILGKNFPDAPLFVGFGSNWARAVSHARYHSSHIDIDPNIYNRRGLVPLHCDVFSLIHLGQVL
jgi:hypothetical protein